MATQPLKAHQCNNVKQNYHVNYAQWKKSLFAFEMFRCWNEVYFVARKGHSPIVFLHHSESPVRGYAVLSAEKIVGQQKVRYNASQPMLDTNLTPSTRNDRVLSKRRAVQTNCFNCTAAIFTGRYLKAPIIVHYVCPVTRHMDTFSIGCNGVGGTSA